MCISIEKRKNVKKTSDFSSFTVYGRTYTLPTFITLVYDIFCSSFLRNIQVENLLKLSNVRPNYLRLNFAYKFLQFIFDSEHVFNIGDVANNFSAR